MAGMISSDAIKSLREHHSWSQADLAERLGVDQATVSRIENGAPQSGPVSRLLEMLVEGATASEERAA